MEQPATNWANTFLVGRQGPGRIQKSDNRISLISGHRGIGFSRLQVTSDGELSTRRPLFRTGPAFGAVVGHCKGRFVVRLWEPCGTRSSDAKAPGMGTVGYADPS